MGFDNLMEGEGFGEDYRKSQEEVKKFNKASEDLEAKKEREEKERLNKDKEVEDNEKGVDVMADQQSETATKILEDAEKAENEEPKRPGFSKPEQGEDFPEKGDQAKKDDDVVDVVSSNKE